MAISINQFQRRIDNVIATVSLKTLDAMEVIALNAKAAINKRIVDTGISFTGSPLEPYTPRYLQFKQDVGRYRGHVDFQLGNYSINARMDAVARRRKEASATLNLLNEQAGFKKNKRRKGKSKDELKELRAQKRARALPTGGTLWRNIGLVEKKEAGGVFRVSVGGTDEINKKKLQGLSAKRGDVLAANFKEQEVIVNSFDTKMGKVINDAFNAQ